MNISFKSCAAALFIAAGIAGCSPTANPSPENDLILDPPVVQLDNPTKTGKSFIDLVCGCPFRLEVEGYFGDTNQVKYVIDRLGSTTNLFSVNVSAAPGVTSGSYEAKLAVKGGVDNFRDTLTMKLIVP